MKAIKIEVGQRVWVDKGTFLIASKITQLPTELFPSRYVVEYFNECRFAYIEEIIFDIYTAISHCRAESDRWLKQAEELQKQIEAEKGN